ncbi:ABC transporter permease [Metabacillus herbersteinensis]|uniref:ABC transporter permease n=1 Tax=Metabacillus herbersteinensis TaxID=283816 RepID=A0ABV6GEG7_9BACI
MNKFWIIIGHTYLNKIKTKSFIITTAITLLFIFGITNMNTIIDFFNKEDEVKRVVVIDETDSLYPAFAENIKAIDTKIKIEGSELSEGGLDQQVVEEKIDGYMILSLDENQLPIGTYKSMALTNNETSLQLEQALQQTKIAVGTTQLGIDQQALTQLFAPVELNKIALEEDAKTEEELNQARGLVYVLLFVIYFSVILYASMIAMEVATEKSSRVMEILISSVSPVKQMFAKLLGIGLLSLTQLGLILGLGYGSMQANMNRMEAMGGSFFGFSEVPTATFVYAGVFFILGYFLFATLAAFLGSLVSRIEDVQQLISPMTLMIVAAFLIAMFGLGNPEAPFITVTSYFPFFTPMIMFLRVGMLNVPFWEIGLSILLLLATIVALAIFGARVYKGGVLMYGKTSSFKDLKKALQLTKKD